MVEQVTQRTSQQQLDAVFSSLGDPTRRDILSRIAKVPMSIGKIATHYDLTFSAIAKHLKVLEQAGLVSKTRRGKEQLVTLSPPALAPASTYLEKYRALWEHRLNSLDRYVKSTNKKKGAT